MWCKCPKDELGVHVHLDKQHPLWDYNLYRMLSDANTKAADVQLWSHHVHTGFNVYGHIPSIVSDIPKPVFFHTMHIGILDQLKMWMFHFIKMQEQIDKYNEIWLSVPAYDDFTHKNQSYEEFLQWNGNEIKEISQYLLGVVAQSLRGGSTAQYPISNYGMECTRALSGSYMYARHKSHDDATFSYMEDIFGPFPTFKDVLLLR